MTPRRRRVPDFDPDRLAACIDHWDVFSQTFYDHPSKGRVSRFAKPSRAVWEAKLICRGCPVRQGCLDWALEHHEPHGVWGGLSSAERARIAHRAIEVWEPELIG